MFSKKSIAKEILIESLNKLNFTSAGNILIPVPLNTLKKYVIQCLNLKNYCDKSMYISLFLNFIEYFHHQNIMLAIFLKLSFSMKLKKI